MGKSLRMVHASGNTFMSLAKTQSDVGQLVDLKPAPLWITLTETAEEETIRAIRAEIIKKGAPYNLLNPDNGDISFLIHHDARIKDHIGRLAIPQKHAPAAEGGHGPRYNSSVALEWQEEIIWANGCHFVTFKTKGGTRGDQQVTQANLMGKAMSHQAKGRVLSVGSGDLNGQLPNRADLQAVFDKWRMTTTAEETGNHTGTHDNARIDYAWTMDKDRRLSVEKMRVLKVREFNSDHDPVVVDLTIRS